MEAVILLAHGTREVGASEPVFRYANELAQRTGLRVEPCFREFIEPSVASVVRRLAADGVHDIAVVPFFLFSSAHVTRDIREDLRAEAERCPHLVFRIGRPVGFDAAVVSVLENRLAEARSSEPEAL